MEHWSFIFISLLYLFALSGLDQQVTGVLAKGLKPKGKFLSYVLWHTMMNQAVALGFALSEPVLLVAALKYVTIVWCWIGGSLDFLYFMMQGEIPEPEKVWHWMPFKPRTWQFAIYALAWLTVIIASWILVLT